MRMWPGEWAHKGKAYQGLEEANVILPCHVGWFNIRYLRKPTPVPLTMGQRKRVSV